MDSLAFVALIVVCSGGCDVVVIILLVVIVTVLVTDVKEIEDDINDCDTIENGVIEVGIKVIVSLVRDTPEE